MSDLISRQAAIDALDGKLEITGRTNAEAVKGYVRLVKDRLERLPPAQPEPQWIPCSERLPEKGKEVLVCYDFKGHRSVLIGALYGDGKFYGYDDEYLTPEGRKPLFGIHSGKRMQTFFGVFMKFKEDNDNADN